MTAVSSLRDRFSTRRYVSFIPPQLDFLADFDPLDPLLTDLFPIRDSIRSKYQLTTAHIRALPIPNINDRFSYTSLASGSSQPGYLQSFSRFHPATLPSESGCDKSQNSPKSSHYFTILRRLFRRTTSFVRSSKPQSVAIFAPRMKSKASVKQEAVKLEAEEETGVPRSTRILRGRLQGFAFMASTKNEESPLAPTNEIMSNAPKKRKRFPSPADTPSKSSPRKPKVYKMELDVPHAPPANWRVTYQAIEEMRNEKAAPVDTIGCYVPMLDARIDQRVYHNFILQPHSCLQTRRFITLISLMLSSQTKDEVTFAAVQNLRQALKPAVADSKEEPLTLEAIRGTSVTSIEECINKVGFWRRKAQYIKSTAEILHKEHGDDIPRTIEGLCSLPGVGMKMEILAMQVAWGGNVGIGVDVHVHRITNGLGWHRKETKNPEETRLNLESWLPQGISSDSCCERYLDEIDALK